MQREPDRDLTIVELHYPNLKPRPHRGGHEKTLYSLCLVIHWATWTIRSKVFRGALQRSKETRTRLHSYGTYKRRSRSGSELAR